MAGTAQPGKTEPAKAIAVALFLGTILLFARAIGHDFVNYDDPDYVTTNTHVQGGLTWAGIRWALTSGEASNWHPLTWISHMLDWSWFGANPRGHHATSVLLHALNAALAFLALRRLTGALWASAVFAALFAWHPLRVESVAWVAERKDVLSGSFCFAVLWAYAGYAEARKEPARGERMRWYVATLAFFALGLMAKPMLVTLPCVLLLLDFWPLRRLAAGNVWRVTAEKLPFFLLAAGSSIATYFVQQRGGAVSSVLPLDDRLANAAVAVMRYLGKFFWPVDLAVLYPHPGDWPAAWVLPALALLLAVSVLAWAQRRRRPWIAVGWLWFVGTLVPVIGIVQVGLQSMADRYTYIPMLGVALALVWSWREVAGSPAGRRVSALVATMILGALAVRTWTQQAVWKNSFTLFDHAIAVTKNNYLAHNNRGLFLCEQGRLEEGIADYRRALAIHPAYPEANNNLGRILVQQGRAAEAVPLLRAALAGRAQSLEVRNNLANALSDVGALDEALTHYEAILRVDPRHAEALNGLGVGLAMKGRLPEAKARLEASLASKPDNPAALVNLGNVCSMLNALDEAARHYRRATELNPSDGNTLALLGGIHLQQGNTAEGVAALQRAVQLVPQHADARAQLGLAYGRLGRREDAMRELSAALRLRPDHPHAREWLDAISTTLPTQR